MIVPGQALGLPAWTSGTVTWPTGALVNGHLKNDRATVARSFISTNGFNIVIDLNYHNSYDGVFSGNVTANSGSGYFIGNGSQLTNLPKTASNYVVNGKLSGSQTINNGSDTVIQFVDDFDPQNWLSSYKFQPTIAGYYDISLSVHWNAGSSGSNQCNSQIRKNGSTQVAIWQDSIQTASGYTQGGTKIIYFKGSSDYVEFTAYTGNTTNQVITNSAGCYFSAALRT